GKAPVADLPLSPPVQMKRTGAEPIAPAAPTLTVQSPKTSRVPLIVGIVFLLLVAVAFAGARGCGAGLGLVSVTMDGAREAPDAPAAVTPEPAAPAATAADDDDAVAPAGDDREPLPDAVVGDTAAVAE